MPNWFSLVQELAPQVPKPPSLVTIRDDGILSSVLSYDCNFLTSGIIDYWIDNEKESFEINGKIKIKNLGGISGLVVILTDILAYDPETNQYQGNGVAIEIDFINNQIRFIKIIDSERLICDSAVIDAIVEKLSNWTNFTISFDSVSNTFSFEILGEMISCNINDVSGMEVIMLFFQRIGTISGYMAILFHDLSLEFK